MDEIGTFAKNITSRHALFVFDSCFGGSVFEAFRDEGLRAPSYITAEVIGPVREFLTAGNELQRVRDNNKFREAFVRGIEGFVHQERTRQTTRKTDTNFPKDSDVGIGAGRFCLSLHFRRELDNPRLPAVR
jgi:hypothetical protein